MNKKVKTVIGRKIMRSLKANIITLILISLAIPALADRLPRGIKPADAYIKSVKIAMLASPPRLEEAMGFLDTILTFHGPYPENP